MLGNHSFYATAVIRTFRSICLCNQYVAVWQDVSVINDDGAPVTDTGWVIKAFTRQDTAVAPGGFSQKLVISFRDANKKIISDLSCHMDNDAGGDNCRYAFVPPANASYGKKFQIDEAKYVPEKTRFIRVEIVGNAKSGLGEDRHWDRVILEPILGY